MTLQGTVNKTLGLTVLLLAGGALGWPAMNTTFGGGLLIVALIVAMVAGVVTSFKPIIARYTAPAYALLEGFVLGGISALMNQSYPGIVITAVEISAGLLIGMLLLYKTGLVQVNQRFRTVVAAATFAIMLTFVVNLVMSLFGASIGLVGGNGLWAIVFSLVVIGVGCANLLVDFDFIDRGVQNLLPKHMEWYGAFAVIVTMVWIYLEVLRLLSKLRSR